MEVFTIAPAGARPLWVLLPVALLLAVVFGVILASIFGARSARFEVSPAGLRLSGDFYGRFIPVESLRAADARRVDLGREPGLRPRWRTMGTGLPGYQAGWFRLANGEKALLYLTDRSKAVHIPTTLGYSLLVSPDNPERFLSALAATGAGR
ncbi:MAG: PH domain-containing protein [Vicinamibacterales bacterium]